MISSASDAAYGQVAASLAPTAVSQYLAASQSWVLETKQDNISEIWLLRERDGQRRGRILLPLATDYVDFPQRFAEALSALGRIHDWNPSQLEEHIRSAHADLLSIRLDQVQADDTIPLRQAETTIDAIYEMLKASAITAATPDRTQRGGRLPASVTSFLEESVRLGHTKRGSFVFTVASRLDSAQEDPIPLEDLQVPSFPRRVMETLARGLETTRDLTLGRSSEAFESPAEWGLSSAFLESLEALVEPEGLRSLDISFDWAVSEGKPDVGNEPILMEHAHAPKLAGIRERLLRREEPLHRETLVGPVMSLARADGELDADEVGSVVISAEVRGRKRNVHMILSDDAHNKAIQSYQLRLPLIVTGDLTFERGAWRLTGDIEVDTSLIRRVQIAAEEYE